MLLALLIAASPLAHVVVPDAVKKEREADAAQKPPELPLFSDPRLTDALGPFEPRPGAWVEYAVLPKKKGPQSRLKLSVLDALPNGRYWLEAQAQQQGTPAVAVKMLLHGPPGRVGSLDRLYVYIEGLAPMEFPLDDVKDPAPSRDVPKIGRLPAQELKLHVGDFLCDVFSVQDARIWRSAKVPLWGLVRAIDREQRVELVGYAESGAQSVFPKEFDQGNGSDSTK